MNVRLGGEASPKDIEMHSRPVAQSEVQYINDESVVVPGGDSSESKSQSETTDSWVRTDLFCHEDDHSGAPSAVNLKRFLVLACKLSHVVSLGYPLGPFTKLHSTKSLRRTLIKKLVKILILSGSVRPLPGVPQDTCWRPVEPDGIEV